MSTTSSLTRSEVKALTRARLLDAALHILDTDGEGSLTTIAVTKRAGIAQSSFYVHFTDMDDLLHSLIEQLSTDRLRQTRKARRESYSAPSDPERFRDTFRIPMSHSIAHPQLFRLLLKSRHDRTTPLGDWSRSVLEENRAALVRDLASVGMPVATEADKRRASMVADGIISLSETMVIGHLEGRFPDLEEAIDVLIAFSRGYFSLLEPRGERPSRRSREEEPISPPRAERRLRPGR